MDADALLTFLTIEREGSFSAAADRLGRSQPAISRRIALLEQDLGAPLFDRAGGGIALSQAGRVLLPLAERALAGMKDAYDGVRALQSRGSGAVSLAVVGTLANANLTVVLRRFAKAHPKVALALSTAASAEVSEMVRRGEAMIGLRYSPDQSGELVSERLAQERLTIVSPRGHRFAGKEVASLAALKDERWFAFPLLSGRVKVAMPPHISTFAAGQGVAEIDWTAVDSLTVQKRLVEAGFGLALVPESAVEEELAKKTLAVIRVRGFAASNPVFVVRRREGYLSAAAQALLEIVTAEYSLKNAKPRAAKR